MFLRLARGQNSGRQESPEPECVIVGHPRLPPDLLNQRPVDMLAVDRGYATQPPTSYEWQSWEKLVSKTDLKHQPRVVLEVWLPSAQLWSKGPTCNGTISR
jgi:hypothetical protein